MSIFSFLMSHIVSFPSFHLFLTLPFFLPSFILPITHFSPPPAFLLSIHYHFLFPPLPLCSILQTTSDA